MNDTFPITIYHNPACGMSRNTLAMIEAAGYTPNVVEYLVEGWTAAHLEKLLVALDIKPRDILREKGTPANELGLLNDGVSDASLIDSMVSHPILVNRPIVVTPIGAKLCRPSELVFDLLERRPATFTKEDGEVV